MLSAMKNNRSLTFYQQTAYIPKSNVTPAYAGGISAVAIANVSSATAQITSGLNAQIAGFQNQISQYNSQLNGFLTSLNAERDALAQNLAEKLSLNPRFDGMRNDGVSLAWDYEAADIRMGGAGSENWTPAEQQEILQNRPDVINKGRDVVGGLEGAEGHHQQNVAHHPEQQADSDNIKFYRSKKEHLDKGHKGNWRNESNEPMTDKNQMLEDTNQRRVDVKEGEIAQSEKRIFRNEFRGLGIAVAIGLGVGATIGFIVTLAQTGVTPESIKLAAIEGAKGGVEAGVLSAVGYSVGRTVGEIATKAVGGLLENLGVVLTDNISKMVGMGVVGSLTITIFSAYQFIKLKRQGIATRDALLQVGKQALFSLSLLAVSIAAQGIWGGPAGIIVSVSIGIILISYTVTTSVHQRHFAEKVRVYMIDKCRPNFAY
jgi:hypothetical protein